MQFAWHVTDGDTAVAEMDRLRVEDVDGDLCLVADVRFECPQGWRGATGTVAMTLTDGVVVLVTDADLEAG